MNLADILFTGVQEPELKDGLTVMENIEVYFFTYFFN